jgi:hypothetical protein
MEIPYYEEDLTMLINRLGVLILSSSIVLSSTAFAQLTAEQALEQMHAQAQAVLIMPLKATYSERIWEYYPPSAIVSYEEGAKVSVEKPGTRTSVKDPVTGEIKETFLTAEAHYDPTINMAVLDYASSIVLYLRNNNYRLEERNPQGGISAIYAFDGSYGQPVGKLKRPEIRMGYYRYQAGAAGVLSPLVMAYHPKRVPNVESCALEHDGDLDKLICKQGDSAHEYWFDPQKNYIIIKFRLRNGDWISEESTVGNVVKLADLYLPGNVENKLYSRDGKVQFRYQASNISWELVSDIDTKFTITPADRVDE